MLHCHCRDCQRASGGPFSSFVIVPSEAFKLLQGSPRFHGSPSEMGGQTHRGFCPECGAPVKSGDKRCWMCFGRLEWENDSAKLHTRNPFAEQAALPEDVPDRPNTAAVMGMILAAGLMIPASLIACFVTCFVVAEANPQGIGIALLTSLAAGIVVFVGFCMLITMLGRF